MIGLIFAAYLAIGIGWCISFQDGTLIERAYRQMGRCPDCHPLTDVEKRNIYLGAVFGLAILAVIWPAHVYVFVKNRGKIA